MRDKAEPVFGDKVALWYCAKCRNSGALAVENRSVYSVLEGMTDHHDALTKKLCDAAIGEGGIGVIKPIDWFNATH